MHWIAPSEKDTDTAALDSSLSASQGERAGVRCWSSSAAEQAVPASHLANAENNGDRPEGLLGLIFLRFAGICFAAQRARLKAEYAVPGQINHH